MAEISNPCALVTGASRGIGREIAIGLARSGFDVVINFAANREAAEQTAKSCVEASLREGRTTRAVLARADIGDSSARARLIRETRDWSPALHLLVNNAGIAPAARADVLEACEESFDRVLAVNLKGPYFLTQLVARWMLEQPTDLSLQPPTDARFHRKIVNISSLSAYAASTNRGDYCISKAGLSMVTALFAKRLAADRINVYEIRPGVIATDMTESVKAKYDSLISQGLTPIDRWGSPADVAKAVVAIAEGALPFSTGEIINVDGGFHMRTI